MKKIIILILVFSVCLSLYTEDKPIISVLDFYTEEGISRSEMRLFISLLSSALFQTKLYIVIDVSERETLLSELEFSVSDCSDESCQLEIGRLLSAEAIIIGRIGRLGSRYVLSIKMLETDTGRAINTADGVYESIDFMVDDVGTIAENLASVHKADAEAKEETITEEEVVPVIEEEIIEEEIEPEEPELLEEEPPVPSPEPRGLYFSLGLGGGPKFPMAQLGELFEPGLTVLITFDMNVTLKRNSLFGFGIVTGLDFEQTQQDHPEVNFPYKISIIPIGGHVRYETGFILPFFLLAELVAGISYGNVKYNEEFNMEDDTFIRPFSGLSGGVGFAFTKHMRIAGGISHIVFFFSNDPLQGANPFIRFERHF